MTTHPALNSRSRAWPSAVKVVILLAAAGCASRSGETPKAAGPREPAARQSAPANYALLIDASSSGSRIHIFEWQPTANGLPEVHAAPTSREAEDPAWQLVVDGGLSDHAGDPASAGESLRPLLDYAHSKLTSVGADPASASLHLKATAGMRLVPEPARGEIMDDVRGVLSSSPFDFSTAEIISGQQEGLFGWISVNYLLGQLGRGPFPTVGALDLGGASTQITFVPIDFPESLGARFKLGGTTYSLYSHSYLGFGQDQARRSVASPDCYPRGYPIPEGTDGIADGTAGRGDFAACREDIRAFLARPCEASRCSSMGVYQPPLYGDFFGFSVYGYVSAFFDLDQNLSLAELQRRGAAYCATDWEQILRDRPDEGGRKYLPTYCFGAAYVVTLLTDGLGFPLDTDRIVTPRGIQGADVSWVLGALVYELAGSAD